MRDRLVFSVTRCKGLASGGVGYRGAAEVQRRWKQARESSQAVKPYYKFPPASM